MIYNCLYNISIQRDYYGIKAIYQRDILIYMVINYTLNYRIINYNYLNSQRNLIINKVNWNTLVTSGKKIKRDSI